MRNVPVNQKRRRINNHEHSIILPSSSLQQGSTMNFTVQLSSFRPRFNVDEVSLTRDMTKPPDYLKLGVHLGVMFGGLGPGNRPLIPYGSHMDPICIPYASIYVPWNIYLHLGHLWIFMIPYAPYIESLPTKLGHIYGVNV